MIELADRKGGTHQHMFYVVFDKLRLQIEKRFVSKYLGSTPRFFWMKLSLGMAWSSDTVTRQAWSSDTVTLQLCLLGREVVTVKCGP